MNVVSRRARIRNLLDAQGEIRFSDLATEFGVSEMTVRRDIDALELEGVARRVRHGAIGMTGRSFEPRFNRRAGAQHEAKSAMARAVVDLLPEEASVILDSGTTVLEVARAVRDGERRLTVVTPSILVALELADHRGGRLVLTGGTVRPDELSLVGPETEESFADLNCDVFVLGAAGLDVERGLTDYNLEEARVKRAAMKAAQQVVAVLDHTKLGRIFFATIAPVTAIDVLVTDAPADDVVVRAVTDLGVRVLLVAGAMP